MQQPRPTPGCNAGLSLSAGSCGSMRPRSPSLRRSLSVDSESTRTTLTPQPSLRLSRTAPAVGGSCAWQRLPSRRASCPTSSTASPAAMERSVPARLCIAVPHRVVASQLHRSRLLMSCNTASACHHACSARVRSHCSIQLAQCSVHSSNPCSTVRLSHLHDSALHHRGAVCASSLSILSFLLAGTPLHRALRPSGRHLSSVCMRRPKARRKRQSSEDAGRVSAAVQDDRYQHKWRRWPRDFIELPIELNARPCVPVAALRPCPGAGSWRSGSGQGAGRIPAAPAGVLAFRRPAAPWDPRGVAARARGPQGHRGTYRDCHLRQGSGPGVATWSLTVAQRPASSSGPAGCGGSHCSL
jgi:hypothetical protein